MAATAQATPNIALIKYWGNSNDDLRIPAASSLSMTLNSPSVSVSVDHAEELFVQSNKELTAVDLGRFEKTVEHIKQFLINEGYETALPGYVSIHIDSAIPAGIGLASSSAIFAGLAKAIASLVDADLSDEQIAIMARLGSGSAARSILSGFVAMDSKGMVQQIATDDHWHLHDIVIAPDTEHKKVGSSQGHRTAHTSPRFDDRIQAIEDYRMNECTDAIHRKDFEKLMHIAEEDCNDMHCVMQTQMPPLQYLSDKTHEIVRDLKSLRSKKHLPVLYTMDAGPTVHLLCTNESVEEVRQYAHEQSGCTIFESGIGKGAYLL